MLAKVSRARRSLLLLLRRSNRSRLGFLGRHWVVRFGVLPAALECQVLLSTLLLGKLVFESHQVSVSKRFTACVLLAK